MPNPVHVPRNQLLAVWSDATLTRAEQARRLGISRSHLAYLASDLGLPGRVPPRRSVLPDTGPAAERIREVWSRKDLTTADKARRLGVSESRLLRRVAALKLRVPAVGTARRRVPDSRIREVWDRKDLTRAEQAGMLGMSPNTLRSRASEMGLVKARSHRPSDERIREAWAHSDLSLTRKAKLLGCSTSTLRERAEALGLPEGRRWFKTVSNAAIRAACSDPKKPLAQVARQLSLSISTLRRRMKAMTLPLRGGPVALLKGDADTALFVEMWHADVATAAMADHFDCRINTIHTSARRLDLPRRSKRSLRAISLECFWRQRREERWGAAMAVVAAADNAAMWRRDRDEGGTMSEERTVIARRRGTTPMRVPLASERSAVLSCSRVVVHEQQATS